MRSHGVRRLKMISISALNVGIADCIVLLEPLFFTALGCWVGFGDTFDNEKPFRIMRGGAAFFEFKSYFRYRAVPTTKRMELFQMLVEQSIFWRLGALNLKVCQKHHCWGTEEHDFEHAEFHQEGTRVVC
jgi:hypothetical protein